VYGSRSSMFNIRTVLAYSAQYYNDPTILGSFVDNHDNARFLNSFNDWKLYQNALTYVLFGQGIPIIYYGSEQAFNGGNDPNNRETLWNRMNPQSYFYLMIQKMVKFRNFIMDELWNAEHVERYVMDNFYAFSRGNVFVATTNVGGSYSRLFYNVADHDFEEGQVLCNLLYPTDCVTITNGQLPVTLMNGESKIFYPKSAMTKFYDTYYNNNNGNIAIRS
jgi:alpha-amylase